MRGSNRVCNIVVWLICAWVLCAVCQAEFRPMYHVAAQVDRPGALAVADLDGNGHPDLLVVSDDDDLMGWCANDGTGTFGASQVIAENLDEVTAVSTADLDGDGDIDILSSAVSYSASYRDAATIVTWYANDGAGGFVPSQTIVIGDFEAQSLHVLDVDGDDDLDILFSAFIPETIWNPRGDSNSPPDDPSLSIIGWYANDGAGRFDSLQTITFEEIELQSTFMADVDADGYVDVLAVVDDYEIAWLRNDGQGQFADRRVIDISTVEVNGLCTGDLNGDGNMDLLMASEDYGGAPSLTWYANQGNGQFEPAREIPAAAELGDGYAVNVVDVDSDGDLDVVAVHYYCVLACTHTITWYANDGAGQFVFKQIVAQTGGYGGGFSSLVAADLDGDADPDILAADPRWGEVRWFENGGLGYGPQVAIDMELDSANGVSTADFDGDGDLDVLAAGSASVGVVWYENKGARQFGPKRVIGEETSSVGRRPIVVSVDWRRICPADLDGDGDTDVLTSIWDGRERYVIYWYDNDGTGTFDLRPVSALEDYAAPGVLTADLDGDGDLDVLGYGGSMIWYANDGSGRFGPMQTITKGSVENLSVADLDGDGDLDIVTTLTWYANDGMGQFGPEQVISTETDGVNLVRAADLDGDNDVDILVVAYRYYTGLNWVRYIGWYANDGTGQFGPRREVSSDVWKVKSMDTADLDGDGDLDVLIGTYNDDEIAWFRNDGPEGFSEKQVLFDRADGVNFVYAADLDDDGDMDILSASSLDNTIALYDNE